MIKKTFSYKFNILVVVEVPLFIFFLHDRESQTIAILFSISHKTLLYISSKISLKLLELLSFSSIIILFKTS